MELSEKLAQELNIRKTQAEAAIRLIDEGNTIPFIARYRKEATGSLNDEVLRSLDERLSYLRNVEERREKILSAIAEQGKLTEELKKKIEEAETLIVLEDLYLPYRAKRRTRAMIAKEKGLEPLARLLMAQEETQPLSAEIAAFLAQREGEPLSAEEALEGAKDILAEEISERAEFRNAIRKTYYAHGFLETVKKADAADPEKTYESYYAYEEPICRIPGHRILAVNRGEKEKVLSVKITGPQEQVLSALKRTIIRKEASETGRILSAVIEDSFKRLMFPSIERDLRNQLTETAEDGAIHVFGENLRQVLLAAPVKGHTVLGWDPAYRTGCKLCIVDPTGKVLYTRVIYPTPPQNQVEESKKILHEIIAKYHVDLISLGNGTASRESEKVITELIRESPTPLSYVIVNEAGASVYSASKLASVEFPNFDVGQRSAASMARRLQDPLAELVKIDPKSIGVGQYQHDMDQKKLETALTNVVEDCVNLVGVDLDTASASLLQYVSGISASLAAGIVAYREEHGAFRNRKELMKVPKLGPKAFQQCAGFLRLPQSEEPLDRTGVHPESYETAKRLIGSLGYREADIVSGGLSGISGRIPSYRALAEELGTGEETLRDIVKELEKPGRDPREDMPKPVLKSEILTMEDLKEGMELSGTVRNITDFGAFVDIGVHQDGLLHISQMSDRFIRHPMEAVKVGDIVNVRVLSVDPGKKRISLTMKKKGKE